MFFKKCPFCNNDINVNYDIKSDEYTLVCNTCSKKGLNISITSNSKEELQHIWNEREFENILLSNPKDFIDIITKVNEKELDDFDNYDIEEFKKIDPFSLERFDYGYLFFPDNTVVKCKDSHPEELLRYLNIEKEDGNFDCGELCYKLGIIRLCGYTRCCMIVLPLKYTKKQIDALIKVLSESKYKILSLFCIYNGEKETQTFNSINDLILYLDDRCRYAS